MMARAALSLSLVGLVLIAVLSAAPLPSGNSGIAARYPSDAGIASDPAVLFADGFESYSSAAGLTSKWSEAYHSANIRVATEAGNVFGGGKSLEFTVPHQSSEVSNTVAKVVSPGQDTLFLRYYARFDAGFNVVGSSHNGSTISAQYCCPGVRANGFNKFLVSYEAWRDSAATAESRQAQRVQSTTRISAISGETTSSPRASSCRFRASPSTSGPSSSPARTSRRCSGAGTPTRSW